MRSSSSRVNGERISTVDRKSAVVGVVCGASMMLAVPVGSARQSERFDDVFLRARHQPLFAQQPFDFRRDIRVELCGILRRHRENLEARSIRRSERPKQIADCRIENLRLDIGLQRTAQYLADHAARIFRIGNGMLARHLGECIGIVVQIRDHFLRFAFVVEQDVAHFECIELRRIHRKVLFDFAVAADLVEHLFLKQAVRDERLEVVETDLQGVQILVHIGGAMQPTHAPELIGALLDFVGAHAHAVLLRGVHGQLVAYHLLDQAFELAREFQQTYEFADIHDFIIDSYDRGHLVRSSGGGPNEQAGWRLYSWLSLRCSAFR
ncbi:hypothetical protein PSAB6_180043 [Paraburkholderia sabiae]|nr:hypothetical protein PSAB6_180043 [Paraburkholderia sabiae]